MKDPLQAFAAANEAYKAMPWSAQHRTQLVFSLEGLSGNKQIKVDQSAADRAYAISKSAAPNHPGVMTARAQYLINSGRWREPEMAGLVGRLETFKRQHETWMISALYHGLNGEQDKAIDAIQHAMDAGAKFEDMQKVANSINLEITEQ